MSFKVEERKFQGKTYDWHKHFLDMTRLVAERSKDTSTKCGCVIVKDKRVLSTGYNGFPRGTDDYDNPKKNGPNSRPEKYFWFEHAERNALYNAALNGVALIGSTAYVTGPPCVDCTRGLIQSGICCIIIPKSHHMTSKARGSNVDKWIEQHEKCLEMMKNASISFFCVDIGE